MLWARKLSEPVVRAMLSFVAVTIVCGGFGLPLATDIRIQPFSNKCWLVMATTNCR